jgi:hypothetical protein
MHQCLTTPDRRKPTTNDPGCFYDTCQCLDAYEIVVPFSVALFLWSFGFSFSDVYELFPLSFVNFICQLHSSVLFY